MLGGALVMDSSGGGARAGQYLMSSSVTMKALQRGWAVLSHTPGFFSTAAESCPVMGMLLVCRALAMADRRVSSVQPGPTPTRTGGWSAQAPEASLPEPRVSFPNLPLQALGPSCDKTGIRACPLGRGGVFTVWEQVSAGLPTQSTSHTPTCAVAGLLNGLQDQGTRALAGLGLDGGEPCPAKPDTCPATPPAGAQRSAMARYFQSFTLLQRPLASAQSSCYPGVTLQAFREVHGLHELLSNVEGIEATQLLLPEKLPPDTQI